MTKRNLKYNPEDLFLIRHQARDEADRRTSSSRSGKQYETVQHPLGWMVVEKDANNAQ